MAGPPRSALTGKIRRRAAKHTPRKRRSTCSTVEDRKFAKIAQNGMENHLFSANLAILISSLFLELSNCTIDELDSDEYFGYLTIGVALLTCAINSFQIALSFAELESGLLDMEDEEWYTSGFCLPPGKARIDTIYINDDQALQDTRCTKVQLRELLLLFDLDECVYVPQDRHNPFGRKYWFHREALIIYMLKRMHSRQTHKDISDNDVKFGGAHSRWTVGYRWIVMYIDNKFAHLIDQRALQMWVGQFPRFARVIYDYVRREKTRQDAAGNPYVLSLTHPFAPTRDNFNICSFMDCSTYEVCRVGSGPVSDEDGARRPTAYNEQRAFYGGHKKVHGIKVLTLFLPNGLTGCVYGPCSVRENDPTLLRWSGLDNAIRQVCEMRFGPGHVYASYADSIFHGSYYCVRTRHRPIPALGIALTPGMRQENAVMKSARESIELGYGFACQMFPLLKVREYMKLRADHDLCLAQVRVVHLLSNCVTCMRRGNTVTGQRMFACDPPSLDEYITGQV
jgi:hypothetical protein